MPLKSDHCRPCPGGRGQAVLPVLLLVLCLAGDAAAVQTWERVPVRRWDWDQVTATTGGRALLDAELRRQGESVRRWSAIHELLGPRQVSAKSQRLLAARGLGPAKLAPGVADPDKALDGVDTLRVLLVRIAFEGNRAPGLTTVSPGGDFRLEPLANPGPLEVDPPPHDKAYFDFAPAGPVGLLPLHVGPPPAHRGPGAARRRPGRLPRRRRGRLRAGRRPFWTIAGLESLVRDMITATDSGTQADGSVQPGRLRRRRPVHLRHLRACRQRLAERHQRRLAQRRADVLREPGRPAGAQQRGQRRRARGR